MNILNPVHILKYFVPDVLGLFLNFVLYSNFLPVGVTEFSVCVCVENKLIQKLSTRFGLWIKFMQLFSPVQREFVGRNFANAQPIVCVYVFLSLCVCVCVLLHHRLVSNGCCLNEVVFRNTET